MTRRAFLGTLGTASALQASSPANWPQYRGPGSTGVSGDDPRLPERWSAVENVAWKTSIPGVGWASPIVWGNRVLVATSVSDTQGTAIEPGFYNAPENPTPPRAVHRWLVLSIDLEAGDVIWQRELHRGTPKTTTHPKNSYASETPVTDGERIYAHFGHLGTYCLNWDGELVWAKPWPPYPTVLGWGTGSSPTLYKDRLYIANDNETDSYLVALEKKTGEEIWRTPRDEVGGWATPYIWENELRTEIVVNGSNRIRSCDLEGRLLWEMQTTPHSAISTPFAAHGLLYIASAFGPTYTLRAGAEGMIEQRPGGGGDFVAWSLPQGGPHNTSPIVYGDYFYTLLDRGFLTCHDAVTGREVYGKQRIDREAGTFTASPWAYNGKLFCLSENGDTFVIRAGQEFETLHKNPLGEFSMSSPAIAQGRLVLRTKSTLFCIREG